MAAKWGQQRAGHPLGVGGRRWRGNRFCPFRCRSLLSRPYAVAMEHWTCSPSPLRCR